MKQQRERWQRARTSEPPPSAHGEALGDHGGADTRGMPHTSASTEWQWMPRVSRTPDGSLRVALPPPRGPLSFVALAASGLVLAVSGLTTILALAAKVKLPVALAATLLLSLLGFVLVAFDRWQANTRSGLSIRLIPGTPAQYEVHRGKSVVERDTLSSDRLALMIAPLPGNSGSVMPRSFVLVLFPRQVDERYRAEIAGRAGYILLHGDVGDPEELYQRTRQICRALGVDIDPVITIG